MAPPPTLKTLPHRARGVRDNAAQEWHPHAHTEGFSAETKDPYGNLKIGTSATTKIKRKDFALSWNAALEAGGVVVGDDVAITLDVQFAKAA